MPNVFISYASVDRKRGEALAAALAGEGFTIAPPLEDASPDAIKARLAESDAALVCWSRASVKSETAFAVAAQAFNRGKLVSVLIQPAEPPAPYDQLEPIDISAWREGRDEADLRI